MRVLKTKPNRKLSLPVKIISAVCLTAGLMLGCQSVKDAYNVSKRKDAEIFLTSGQTVSMSRIKEYLDIVSNNKEKKEFRKAIADLLDSYTYKTATPSDCHSILRLFPRQMDEITKSLFFKIKKRALPLPCVDQLCNKSGLILEI